MLHSIVALPSYVVNYAPQLISDRAFVVMLMMQSATKKSDWEVVACYLQYENVGPLTVMLNDLAEKELIDLNNYKVDWTPLFNRCYELAIGEVPVIVKPKKEKKDNSMFVLYGDMIKQFVHIQGSKYHWANDVLPKLLKKYSREEILDYVGWQAEYHTQVPSQNLNGGIKPSNISIDMANWVKHGKPKTANYKLYNTMVAVTKGYLKGGAETWLIKLLPELEKEYSQDDILDFCKWATSYYLATPKSGIDNRGIYPNSVATNIKRWLDAGSQKVYSEKTDFSGL